MSDKFRHKTSGVHLTFQVVVLFKNVRIFLDFEQSYDEAGDAFLHYAAVLKLLLWAILSRSFVSFVYLYS